MKKPVLLIIASLALALTSCNLLPMMNQSRRSKSSSESVLETSFNSSSDSSSSRRSSSRKSSSSSSELPTNPIDRYGTVHNGTVDDPFDNEDALKVAKSPSYDNRDYYVKGVVDSFYYAPTVRTDGMIAFYLKPAIEGDERFEIYRCFKEDGSAVGDDEIWIGGLVTVHGVFGVYNGQYETTNASFVSCTGEKPVQTIEFKTFEEVLAIGYALPDGGESADKVKFQGYVTFMQGQNYYMTATEGEELISATSDPEHGSRDYYVNAIELYAAGRVEGMDAILLKNAKIEVTMIVKNYHGTVENARNLTLDDITVMQEGGTWFTAEPEAINCSILEFLSLPNNKNRAYIVSGTIISFSEGEIKNDTGTMMIFDGVKELKIYGCTATDTALYWDNISSYSYARTTDFLTNEITAGLIIGSQVTMKLIRNDRQGEIQAVGIIISVG